MAQEQHPNEPPTPPIVDPADLDFEREIAARHPTRKTICRFDFPEEVDDARAVYMMRLVGRDEIEIAGNAEAIMTADERRSMARAIDAERREGIRYSIVALVDANGNRRLIDQGVPLMEIDEWSSQAWACLRTWFGDLNGVNQAALGKSVAVARKIGSATATTDRAIRMKAL